ncbi:MAG: cytochrome c-type biogenesis CcmF C-terminal domain-containing protein, partial [Dongiaceae bacterium]
YELGWGGWWFWDPVENASFMPWLAGTALVHSATVVEKRDALKSWTILLAILAFSLSLIGTFLVRSGVLTSVHAFAVDPARGVFILALLTLAIGGSLTLYALRAPTLKTGGLFAPISREGGLVLNNILMATAAATVFIGTLYPLFLDAVGGGKVSVGAPYFDVTFGLLMVPALLAMAAGPLLPWKRADLAGALGRLKLAAAIVAVVVAATWSVRTDASILALFGIALAAWVVGSAVVEMAERVKLFRVPLGDSLRRAGGVPRAAYGMTVAHIGVGIVVAGITASSAWRTESIQVMRPGDSVAVAGYDFAFDGAEELQGPNYTIQRGTFTVTRDGRMVARLFPEQRFYTVEQRQTTEAAIHTTWLADLYAVVGDPDGTGGWVTRLYHNPLVPWLWIGTIVIALGGGLSLSDRRHRVGAPARKRRAVPAGA